MILLPIVDRELRVSARRAGTYWLRFWMALVVLVIWLVVLLNTKYVQPVQMGQHLLNALGVLTLGFCMFVVAWSPYGVPPIPTCHDAFRTTLSSVFVEIVSESSENWSSIEFAIGF